jgi:hypothetical protein
MGSEESFKAMEDKTPIYHSKVGRAIWVDRFHITGQYIN